MTQREKKYIGRKRQKKQCRQTYDTAQYHLKTTPTEGTTHPNPLEGRELDMLLLIDLWFIRKSVGCFLFYFSVNNRSQVKHSVIVIPRSDAESRKHR